MCTSPTANYKLELLEALVQREQCIWRIQRSCGCPIPGSVQDQVGHRGLEQPALVGGVPARGRGWNWVSFKVPSNSDHPVILWEEEQTQRPEQSEGVNLYFMRYMQWSLRGQL